MARLRAVAPGEAPKPAASKKPAKNISEALSGSERDVWAAMRKALAKKIDDGEVSPNAIASTYKELRELDRLIREFDRVASEEVGPSDGSDEAFDEEAI